MISKKTKSTHRAAKHLYKTSDPKKSFQRIADELEVSVASLFRWQKEDMNAGLGKWDDKRKEHFAKKADREETKDLVVDTKKELSELFDRNKTQEKQLEALNKIQELLMSPDILDRMTSQAKIRDYLDLTQAYNKIREGFGFADKVIVIGATKPETDIIETEFEILED